MSDSQSSTPHRVCSRCHTQKPLTSAFFHWEKQRGQYRTICRSCRNQQRNERTRKRYKHFDLERGTRICSVCETEFPATVEYFTPTKKSPDGLASQCRECVREIQKRAYAAKPERSKASDKQYRDRNRAKIEAYQKRWRAQNQGYIQGYNRAYHQANRDKLAKQKRKWLDANPERKAAWGRNRYARKCAALGTHTAEDVAAQLARQKGKCFYCHKKVGKKYHVDHVTPLVGGGSNGPENLVVACSTCNLSKGTKHPMDFCGRLL